MPIMTVSKKDTLKKLNLSKKNNSKLFMKKQNAKFQSKFKTMPL